MSWEKVDYKGLWFHLPIRSGDFLMNLANHKMSEHLGIRPGWLLKKDNSEYMIPQQTMDLFNSELWVGITKDNLEYVHCLSPEKPRVITTDETNPLTELYKECGLPAFYILENTKTIEENSSGEFEENQETITKLMNPYEMQTYCEKWVNVLNQFPEERIDVLNVSDGVKLAMGNVDITKEYLTDYFSKQKDYAEKTIECEYSKASSK
ncbi:MAG: hypothetical protein KAT28_04255 [Candidatus Aenigmarchaeota archaeon]|nr:hypothetical protein [Candidatus Aenigmarchaeota archaeon]